jgi:hypothetical protein
MKPGPRDSFWGFRRKPDIPNSGIPNSGIPNPGIPNPPETRASFISTFAVLLLLYIAACITISVLGGIFDFILYDVLPNSKLHYSPEDTFKMGLLRSGPPILVTNILARIPINIVDRFVVIFGGFSISLLLRGVFSDKRQ